MNGRTQLCAALFLFAWMPLASAEPWIASREGFHCGHCHVDPTGGGMRNEVGNIYAQTQLARQRISTGEDLWTGMIGKHVGIGGDLRGSARYSDASGEDSASEFVLDEVRLYARLALIPGRLEIYLDEHVAPGGANNQNAWVLYSFSDGGWYLKAGQFYLPYGWRLEDDGAYVREVTGINFATSDQGVELGWTGARWSVQTSVTNGTAGGPETDNGKQFSGRLEYLRGIWRAGVSGNFNDSDAGDRSMGGVFGSLRTGPITWLGEADYIVDEATPTGHRELWAGLLEANWLVRQGDNLKLTAEYFEPDVDVDEDQQNRYSLVWEHSPIEFMQLRLGIRVYDGIPQNAEQNSEMAFLELHGYF